MSDLLPQKVLRLWNISLCNFWYFSHSTLILMEMIHTWRGTWCEFFSASRFSHPGVAIIEILTLVGATCYKATTVLIMAGSMMWNIFDDNDDVNKTTLATMSTRCKPRCRRAILLSPHFCSLFASTHHLRCCFAHSCFSRCCSCCRWRLCWCFCWHRW